MKFVCPQPIRWNEIYQGLYDAWKTKWLSDNPPPVPLILNGWVFSDDFDKHHRWLYTIHWAQSMGLGHLIPELSENEKYQVLEFSSYVWPQYGEQHHEPSNKPAASELRASLEKLKRDWQQIAGPILFDKTRPIRFTGKKRRRLVVSADPTFSPPWGSWHWVTKDGDKRSFTKFRASVNHAIQPLTVDHIDFIFPVKKNEESSHNKQ